VAPLFLCDTTANASNFVLQSSRPSLRIAHVIAISRLRSYIQSGAVHKVSFSVHTSSSITRTVRNPASIANSSEGPLFSQLVGCLGPHGTRATGHRSQATTVRSISS
ncbi:unnamed protein product, partial [Ectocarpus sp. 12 AP-2014]